MNQILETRLKNNKFNLIKNTKFLKAQFCLSIIIIVIIIIIALFNILSLAKAESYSDQILNNYGITKLYADSNSGSGIIVDLDSNKPFVIGTIEIPKINIYYPIFSSYNEELLKISPCRFYGPNIGKKGNLCIAGHNYDNNKFFSKISDLNVGDEIILYNSFDKKYSYFVKEKYEVSPTNLSPIYSYDKNLVGLTLITCNNFNKKRIIVKAFV